MKKKTPKKESQKNKKRETIFQDTEKDKTRPNKCKKVPTQRRKQTKLILR